MSDKAGPAASSSAASDVAFDADYRTATEAYQQRLGDIQERGQTALVSGDEQAVLDVYSALRDASAATADELEDLDPPEHLLERRNAVVRNLRRQTTALDDIIAAAGSRDDAALTEGLRTFAGLLIEFATAHAAIDQELARGP